MTQLSEATKTEEEFAKLVAYQSQIKAECEDTDEHNDIGTSDTKETTRSLPEKHWIDKRAALRVHGDAMDALMVMKTNNAAWDLLSTDHQRTISAVMSFFCPLQNRFFESQESMENARMKRLGFNTAPMIPIGVPCASMSVITALNRSINDLLPSLWPSHDFALKREAARLRIQQMLCSSGVLPLGTDLCVFGSSRNNFGSDGADLDMCLIVPTNNTSLMIGSKLSQGPVNGAEQKEVIERIGEYLQSSGEMKDVKVRSTARVPIVLFKDPTTELDCDISFNNPLALRNTALLNIYSRIDDRVRALAFLIKKWAKQKDLNDPQKGTLSSYGYILCLLYFLQTRNPPVLPSLQQLPEDWLGKTLSTKPVQLPVRYESHPVDGRPCNTYFYNPASTGGGFALLQNFASKNRQTVAELFCEFFNFYSWGFNFRHHVVSIRYGAPLSKLEKAETACWFLHDRLCIEDPFELNFDVAHVVSAAKKDSLLRDEMIRVHTLIHRACGSINSEEVNGIEKLKYEHDIEDKLPSKVLPDKLLAIILEERVSEADTHILHTDATVHTVGDDKGVANIL
eukprot:CAMPEP_0182437790 /NCGR_PEP_ID=MMETSP1167-20130531/85285_1 /TAXON_ID=2988 /ORGANISM="Mallomonas Sp, Strain CCMP3275" /LENGTH=567 /DNA_ID=CAMNT_0024630833 /DNA_START=1036 /DNA_END=2739 /DNA_ORIENTATION=-